MVFVQFSVWHSFWLDYLTIMTNFITDYQYWLSWPILSWLIKLWRIISWLIISWLIIMPDYHDCKSNLYGRSSNRTAQFNMRTTDILTDLLTFPWVVSVWWLPWNKVGASDRNKAVECEADNNKITQPLRDITNPKFHNLLTICTLFIK